MPEGAVMKGKTVSQPSTNELLGYPRDARLLIINADDYGMCHAITAGIVRAASEGIVTSTSLMAPCPWAPYATTLLEEHPEIPFGVHLTMVAEHPRYRWSSLVSKDRVPSLIDESGCFYTDDRREEILARAMIEEIEVEFRAQIGSVLATGLKPTHLDWHCLADGGRPDIFALTFALAREYGLALRAHFPSSAEICRNAGLPVADHGVLDSYGLDSTGKTDRYLALLHQLPAGLSEWAIHPSLGDAEAQAMEPGSWQVRKADLDFALSPAARQVIEEEGIVLLSYRELQRAWLDRN
jgi:predicted glycoside hydrolase/deacetylase ChbG (UPF0249 family)